jgi:hypothetical protein
MAIPPIHQGMGFCLQPGVLNLDLESLNDYDGADLQVSASKVSWGKAIRIKMERAGVLDL